MVLFGCEMTPKWFNSKVIKQPLSLTIVHNIIVGCGKYNIKTIL